MDKDGFCDFACPESVARVAGVSAEEGVKAMEILMSPDKRNPGQENDGRRVKKVDGGYLVINKPKYDVVFKKEIIRQQTAERVARFRMKRAAGDGDENANGVDVVEEEDQVEEEEEVVVQEEPKEEPKSVEVRTPSKEEWAEICGMQGIPAWRAEEEWLRQEARDTPWRGLNLAGHAARVRKWWQDSGCPADPATAKAGKSGLPGKQWALKQLMFQKQQEFEVERDPMVRKQLKAEILGLEQHLKEVNEEIARGDGGNNK